MKDVKVNLGLAAGSGIPPCATCKWCVRHKINEYRCHYGPPTLRLPYDNLAVWLPIAEVGPTGCSKHKLKKDK